MGIALWQHFVRGVLGENRCHGGAIIWPQEAIEDYTPTDDDLLRPGSKTVVCTSSGVLTTLRPAQDALSLGGFDR